MHLPAATGCLPSATRIVRNYPLCEWHDESRSGVNPMSTQARLLVQGLIIGLSTANLLGPPASGWILLGLGILNAAVLMRQASAA